MRSQQVKIIFKSSSCILQLQHMQKYLSYEQNNNNNNFVGMKEGNVLFNDALNTFYLRLYGVRHLVKDH